MVNNDFDGMFDAAGQYYNVDPALLKTIFHIESGGNAAIGRGTSGEIGGMQLMPATAAQYHVVDPQDMAQSIPAAAQIIRKNLDATNGNVAAALQMYNGGAGGPTNPRTFPYVQKALNLYPQMQVKQQQSQNNAAVDLGDQIISGGPPRTGAAAADPAVSAGDALISQTLQGVQGAREAPASTSNTHEPSMSLPPPQPNPQTGATDTMAPGLRSFIQENPNYTYGTVLPLARNNETGKLSLAVPGAIHDLAGGLLDLAEGPATGTVTPQGTMALTNMLTQSPRLFGSPASPAANAMRAPDVAAPFSPEYQAFRETLGPKTMTPTEDPSDAGTGKVADLLHSLIARQIGRSAGAMLGHTLGNVPGAIVGYMLEPYLQGLAADYGQKAASAVVQSMKNKYKGFMPENYMWRAAPTVQQPNQNPLVDNRPLA